MHLDLFSSYREATRPLGKSLSYPLYSANIYLSAD